MNVFSSHVHSPFTRGVYGVGVKTFLIALLVPGLVHGAFAATQALQIDRTQSQIEVAVKATMDSFIAELEVFEPEIVFDPNTQQFERVEITFAFADLHTGKKDRDRQMNEWQQTPEFPQARFELVRLDPTENGRRLAHGTLHLHGVSLPMTFPVVLRFDGARLSIDGEAPLDTRDLGLPVIRKFKILKVDPHVTVRFHVQGMLAATAPAVAVK